jgi:hypothetical protein
MPNFENTVNGSDIFIVKRDQSCGGRFKKLIYTTQHLKTAIQELFEDSVKTPNWKDPYERQTEEEIFFEKRPTHPV